MQDGVYKGDILTTLFIAFSKWIIDHNCVDLGNNGNILQIVFMCLVFIITN